MQVQSIAECLEHSAILSTSIKLPFVIKIFVLSIFELSLKTGFTVCIITTAIPGRNVKAFITGEMLVGK